MKNLIIIGARGFGREIYSLAIECKEYMKEYVIKGFLDSKADALDNYDGYPLILGDVESYEVQDEDIFICALGEVEAKRKYTELILNKGGIFTTLIHPTAYISKNTILGAGCIICRNVLISCDIQIGNHVTIQPFSDIGHDAKIADWCHLNTYSFMGGFAELGEMATIHTGGIVLPHKKIEQNAIVGAGSVVIRNVKKDTTVFGIPAKKIT